MSSGIILRDYQKRAIEATLEALHQHQATLLVMATGLGKSVVFSEIVRHYAALGKVLVLAHREELIWQAKEHLDDLAPGVEMAYWRDASGHWKKRVVVGTVQTVSRKNRLDAIDASGYSLLVIDEAHHVPAATYRRIIDKFKEAGVKILGVTATPNRSDKYSLAVAFNDVAYVYDLANGIRDGWLVPVKQYFVKDIHVDFSGIKIRHGDFAPEQLERVLMEEKNLHAVAKVAMDASKDGPVLVFTVGVEQANRLADIVCRYKAGMAKSVSQDTPKMVRRGIMEDFKTGALPILCNCMIATEGFDAPKTASIVMARPTRSLLLYTQMLGRGTRPLPGVVDGKETAEERRLAIAQSKKPCLFVYDMSGRTQAHKIVSSIDILGGRMPDNERIRFLSEYTMKAPEDIKDVLAELEAWKQMQELKISLGRANIKAKKVDYKLKYQSPFAVLDVEPSMDDLNTYATPAQIAQLKQFGVSGEGLTAKQAENLLEELRERRRRGLASYKQMKMLLSRGLDYEVVRKLTQKEAGVLIDSLGRGGWVRFTSPKPPLTVGQLEEMRQKGMFHRNAKAYT